MNISEDISRGLIGFYPIYSDGDRTAVACGDGSLSVLDINVRRYLKALAGYYDTDLASLARHTAEKLGQKYSNPLVIGGEVWVPFYVRKPAVKGDTCTGYFALRYIEGLSREENVITLRLNSGISMRIYHRAATAHKRLNSARLLEEETYGRREAELLRILETAGGAYLMSKKNAYRT
mgnify:CR=1 FL=1